MKVKIEKQGEMYVARTKDGDAPSALAAMSADRDKLVRIYEEAGHEIVRKWS